MNDPAYQRHREALISIVEDFKDLPNNWNSYGAPQIEKIAIDKAIELLLRMEGDLPTVVPTTKGGVQLEWTSTEVEIDKDGIIDIYVEKDS